MEIFVQRTSMLNAINFVGGAFRKIGLDPFKLNAKKIIQKSVQRTNFEGTVPESVEIGLNKLISSIQSESNVNPFGALALKGMLERAVYGRLKIEQAIKDDPSILDRPIKEPVFIIGMPRTGTTILHALLHQDPAHRSPLAWECLIPYPVATPDNKNDNPSLDIVEREFEQLFKLVPDLQKKHYLEATAPQECLGITMFDFNSFQVLAQVYAPSYLEWFMNHSDQLQTLRFHKSFLQYLETGGVKSKRWLLKTPVHLMRLSELFEVYPDAKVIMSHRHPEKVVASAASLVSSVRSLYSDHESAHRSGKEQAEMWSESFQRFLKIRKEIDKEDQIIDIKFEDFVGDQIGMVRKIYERFNWELSDEAINNMTNFLNENPKDKHGAHNYSLEQFGLTKENITQQYSQYIDLLEKL